MSFCPAHPVVGVLCRGASPWLMRMTVVSNSQEPGCEENPRPHPRAHARGFAEARGRQGPLLLPGAHRPPPHFPYAPASRFSTARRPAHPLVSITCIPTAMTPTVSTCPARPTAGVAASRGQGLCLLILSPRTQHTQRPSAEWTRDSGHQRGNWAISAILMISDEGRHRTRPGKGKAGWKVQPLPLPGPAASRPGNQPGGGGGTGTSAQGGER